MHYSICLVANLHGMPCKPMTTGSVRPSVVHKGYELGHFQAWLPSAGRNCLRNGVWHSLAGPSNFEAWPGWAGLLCWRNLAWHSHAGRSHYVARGRDDWSPWSPAHLTFTLALGITHHIRITLSSIGNIGAPATPTPHFTTPTLHATTPHATTTTPRVRALKGRLCTMIRYQKPNRKGNLTMSPFVKCSKLILLGMNPLHEMHTLFDSTLGFPGEGHKDYRNLKIASANITSWFGGKAP